MLESCISNISGFFNKERKDFGLIVPEYQRDYAWEEEELQRFLIDIGSGVETLIHGDPTTFLGTVVLCKRERFDLEPTFEGYSYDIVDGQQRLTTSALLILSILQNLQLSYHDFYNGSQVSADIKQLLSRTYDRTLKLLKNFLFGSHGDIIDLKPFPRLVREEDIRAIDTRDEENNSPIAKFFEIARKTMILSKETNLDLSLITSPDELTERLKATFLFFTEYQNKICIQQYHDDNEIPFIRKNDFNRSSINNLIETNNYPNEISKFIINDGAFEKFIRNLLFARYFLEKCSFAIIETDDEDLAFDTFDALNTTGVPLTSIQTLKPQVMRAYRSSTRNIRKWSNTPSSTHFKNIDEKIRIENPTTEQQQSDSKKIVTAGALLINGAKISEKLSTQRAYLSNAFKATEISDIDLIPELLSETTTFYDEFFTKKANPTYTNPLNKLSNDEIEELKLINILFASCNSFLTLPIQTSFWIECKKRNDYRDFYIASKKLCAFFVLKRAPVQGARGIDASLRKLMNKDIETGYSGLNREFEKTPASLDEFSKALIDRLKDKDFEFDLNEKDKWVKQVIKINQFRNSKSLLRFMMYAAHQNTGPSQFKKGIVERIGNTNSTSSNYLNFNAWNNPIYQSIEHVAPRTEPSVKHGYYKVYDDPLTKNLLGNFTLLPKWQNSSLKNSEWSIKKLFFQAISERSTQTRKSLEQNAQPVKLPPAISKKLSDKNTSEVEMIKGLGDVQKWDENFILERSEALASNVWDEMVDWLK